MTSALSSRNAVFRSFFDQKKIMRAVNKTERRQLMRVGGLTKTIARRSIRKRKRKISAPGNPPFSKRGGLRKNIFFAYDEIRRAVVVGPVKLPSRLNYIAPKVLETSGTVRVRRQRGQGPAKIVTKQYHARPFMKPAQEKAADKFPELFKGSL